VLARDQPALLISGQAVRVAARLSENHDPAVGAESPNPISGNIAEEETLFLVEPNRAFGKLKSRCDALTNYSLAEEALKVFRFDFQRASPQVPGFDPSH
jgi:hypothetical protein